SRFDDSKMPVTALNALPMSISDAVKKKFPSVHIPPYIYYYGFARIPTMLFSLLVLLIIFFWTKNLLNTYAATLAAFLFSVSPNIIAHSRLITNDIYAMGGIFISIYTLYLYFKRRSLFALFFLSISVSFAIISKFTSLFLYPLLFLIIILKYWKTVFFILKKKSILQLSKFCRFFALHLIFFIVINFFLINAAYFFNGTFRTLESFNPKSNEFKSLMRIPIIRKIPLPLPSPMIEGLDWISYNQKIGKSFGNIYMLGKHARRGEGFKTYYFVVWLFKIPIGTQMLFYLSIIVFLFNHRRSVISILYDPLFLFLLLPSLYFFCLLSFILKAQLGVRYFLICMPFIIVFSSVVCGNIAKKNKLVKIFTILCPIYVFCSGLTYYPHYIAYFNEFSLDRKNNWKILADSNLDWGQNIKYLAEYLKKHPDTIYNPLQVTKGHIVVEANQLAGVTAPPEKYAWLRKNEATNHIAYSYIVFDIK
ncbi:MAG TPA: glycosyltransferase family 39 protein, partial [Victivallales bacterium]|nr:glycosyltransferase family 39 protein [Victivallales bacterium]